MKTFPSTLPVLALLMLSLPLRAAESATTGLAGSWHIDAARSTELSPWKSCDLVITLRNREVSIERKLAWGRREFVDQITIDTSKPETVLPIDWWADNRHLGAYIGADHTRHVHAEWLDDGRILRLSINLVLEVQQGPRAVNILSEYKVSANGAQLTLTELRSTRNRPVVYVFTRAK